MADPVFGDLRDWGRVLSLLDKLTKTNKLNNHQQELLEILRDRENWKLREAVLESVKNLDSPSDEILEEILNIMMDDMAYYNARILAADALIHLLQKRETGQERSHAVTVDVVIEKMLSLLNSPLPSFLHEAICRSLEEIRESPKNRSKDAVEENGGRR